MTNENGIHLPDLPHDSDPKMLVRFCSELHVACDKLYRAIILLKSNQNNLITTMEGKPGDVDARGMRQITLANEAKVNEMRREYDKIKWWLIGLWSTVTIGLIGWIAKFILDRME